MDAPPGLLPDESPRPFPIARVAVGVFFIALAGLAIFAFNRLQSAEKDRDRLEKELQQERSRPRVISNGTQNDGAAEREASRKQIAVLENRIASLEAAKPPVAETRNVSPEKKRAETYELMERGQRDFRARHYSDAERSFNRAEISDPTSAEPYGGLALIRFVQALYIYAWENLRRAFLLDSNWLRNSRPPEQYFSDREEYLKYLKSIESYVERNPTATDVKLFLAYVYYHEKGVNQAQYIVTEILRTNPENADAQVFQKQIDAATR